jgi:hypothetical protein
MLPGIAFLYFQRFRPLVLRFWFCRDIITAHVVIEENSNASPLIRATDKPYRFKLRRFALISALI